MGHIIAPLISLKSNQNSLSFSPKFRFETTGGLCVCVSRIWPLVAFFRIFKQATTSERQPRVWPLTPEGKHKETKTKIKEEHSRKLLINKYMEIHCCFFYYYFQNCFVWLCAPVRVFAFSFFSPIFFFLEKKGVLFTLRHFYREGCFSLVQPKQNHYGRKNKTNPK